MHISVAHVRGQKPIQEDRFVCVPIANGYLIAVFDGHGGHQVADQAAEILPGLFSEFLTNEKPAEALFSAFNELVSRFSTILTGSTASAAYIVRNQVVIAILGDSPVLCLTSSGDFFMGPEHNMFCHPDDVSEIAPKTFGFDDNYIYLENGDSLALTRALGDADFDKLIIRTPEIFTFDLKDEGVVLVASDGISPPMLGPERQKQYIGFAKAALEGEDARTLINRVKSFHDNTTLIAARYSAAKQ
jgi:serine/threonine protein phosphatase PrpC